MKIFPADNNVGWLALLGLLALVLGNSTATQPIAEKEQTPSVPRQGDGAFRSCAALTAGREGPIAFGQGPIVTFLGAISCGTPVEIHIEDGEVLLRADTSLDTTGIYFAVHPGATLTLQAPTISIKGISDHDHERSHPLFTVEGRLVLDATSSLPVIAKSKISWLEDRHGIMSLSSKAIVDSGQTVFYDKNSVNIGRMPADLFLSQAEDVPVLFIDCQALVRVSVHDWTPAVSEGIPEDKSGLVDAQEEDFLESAVMRAGNCSDDAIAAAEPVDGVGSEEEEAIKSVDLPPDPADALAESHADLTARRITALTTDDDTQPASPMASADRNLPPGDSGTDSARPSSSPAAAADAGAKEPTPDHDDRDDATTTPTHPATTDAAADGSTTPKAGSVFSAPAALSPHEANANDHAHAHAASLGEVSDDGDAHLTKLNGVVQSCDDLPAAFSRGVMTLVDDLICPHAKVVVISGDATIRSESDILTKDIFWVVQPGVSVTFEAPTVTLVRGSKMDRRSVLSVGAGGFVHFRVNERLPSSWGNSLEQQHGFVVFLVDEGVRVRFHAPMVTSSQEKLFLSQAEDVPVLFIDCQASVRVSVHDWTPAVSEGIPEDKNGLVNTQEEDFLESAVMRARNCSDDAIAAAEPVDGGGSEEEEAIKSVDLPPDPADAMAESHADLAARRTTALTIDDDTQPASPMASADRNLPPGDSGTDIARPSSSPAAAAVAGAKEPTTDHDDRDDATTTPTHPATTDAAAECSTTPKAGSVFSDFAALSPHEANANDHAHAHAASLGEVSDDGDAHLTKLNGVVQSCEDFPAFSRGVMTLVDDLVCPHATMDRRPVLSVGAGGFVHFRVNERLPSSWGNSLEQQHGFVVFLVDEGVRVRFHAPMVTSSQEKLFLSQAEDVPVLFIDCQALVRVSVHDWTPAVSERISRAAIACFGAPRAGLSIQAGVRTPYLLLWDRDSLRASALPNTSASSTPIQPSLSPHLSPLLRTAMPTSRAAAAAVFTTNVPPTFPEEIAPAFPKQQHRATAAAAESLFHRARVCRSVCSRAVESYATTVGLPSRGCISTREDGVGPARWCRLGPWGGEDAGSDGLVEWTLPAVQAGVAVAPGADSRDNADYNRLFRFLASVKRASLELERIWPTLMQSRYRGKGD
eukprot:g13481.t1